MFSGHRGLHGRHGLQDGGHEEGRHRSAGGHQDTRAAPQDSHGGRAEGLRRQVQDHRDHEPVHR